MNLNITPEMVLELYADERTYDGGEEAMTLYVSRDGWTVGMVPAGLPSGLPTCLAIVNQPGEILHNRTFGMSREDAIAKFTSGRYAIPFEDGTVREPRPGEKPEIAFAASLTRFEPDGCWWFDGATATLMAAEREDHEDIDDDRFSLRRTAGGRYVETKYSDGSETGWYLSFQVPRWLTTPKAAQHLFEDYRHVTDGTDPDGMTAPLAVAFQLGRMMSTFSMTMVKVPAVEQELRDGDYRIAHAKQKFADAADLAEFVRNDLLPTLRDRRVSALWDLLRELQSRSERPCALEDLLPDAAKLLGVSERTITEMFKRG